MANTISTPLSARQLQFVFTPHGGCSEQQSVFYINELRFGCNCVNYPQNANQTNMSTSEWDKIDYTFAFSVSHVGVK